MKEQQRDDSGEDRLTTPYDQVIAAFRDGLAPLRSGPRRGPVLAVLSVGALIALVLVGVTSTAIERTGTTEYCTGCHVYEAFGEAYRRTIHYANARGVRAECGDCHIPHGPWPDTLLVKIRSGLSSVSAYTLGGIDTPEAFEARRPELVRAVWRQYRRRGSDFCANCHVAEHWDAQAQPLAARAAHRAVVAGQAQCIDCHLGVAHELPASLPADMPASVHPDGPPRARPRAMDGPSSAADPAQEDASPAAGGDASGSTGIVDAVPGASNDQPSSTEAAGDDFAPCAACHGVFAPAAEQLAGLDLEVFLAHLAEHPPAGGAIAALDDPERRALHAQLRAR